MKILIIQTAFLGDVILSTPVIEGVRRRYPDAKIWMMVTPGGRNLIKHDPRLAGILVFDKRKKDSGIRGFLRKLREVRTHQFDRVYALQRSLRTTLLVSLAGIPERVGFKKAHASFLYHHRFERDKTKHDALRNLAILGNDISLEDVDQRLQVFPPEDSLIRKDLLEQIHSPGKKGIIAMFPGSAWYTKMWHWTGYRAVGEYFENRGYQILIPGGPGEEDVVERVSAGTAMVNLSGKTSLEEVLYIVDQSDLLICNDSMALHLGSALQTPTVAIFCATSPEFGFGPWKNMAVVVEKKGLPCKPCHRHGGNSCPTKTEACMRELSPQRVIEAGEKLLGHSNIINSVKGIN